MMQQNLTSKEKTNHIDFKTFEATFKDKPESLFNQLIECID